MSESTAVAESSSAPTVEVVDLPRSGTSDYAEWRVTGDLPEPKPKTEEPAPSTKENQAEKGESAPPNKQQEKSKTEKRFQKLLEENRRLKAETEAAKSPKVVEQAKPQGRTKPTAEDKSQDGKPKYSTYEDFVEDLADWKAEQRLAQHEQERQGRQQQEAIKSDLEKARSRYDNLDEVIFPALNKITGDAAVSPVVKAMLNDSEVLPDLLYTIGGEGLEDFLKMAKSSPGKAIRYLAITENLIREELDKGSTGRNDKGQFEAPKSETTPAKRGPESSPEPPIEIGNRGTGPMDESAKALSAIERGDANAVRAWMKAENAKDLRRRRGV